MVFSGRKHRNEVLNILLEKAGISEPRAAAHLWRFMAGPDAIARLLRNPYVPAHLMEWSMADRVGSV